MISESKSINPLMADYLPQVGDVLVSASIARAVVRSIEDGDVCFDVNHGSRFVESRRLSLETFAEMARGQAIALDRATEDGGC